MKAIVFDYYMNFIPYFANLFSPLFVFIAVIFFTSKLAGNSEIIAMLAAGVSFKRLMRPYMITCILISAVSFYLSGYVIPHSNVIRQDFESLYKNNKKNTAADNVMLQVGSGVIAYIQQYDNNTKRGYGFSLDKFQDKKLVSHMTATEIQYDTISDSKYHWTALNYKIRKFNGYREQIENGEKKDTTIMMEPTDLVYSKGQQETFTNPELSDYISKQIDRGSSNVVQYQVEYHKRIAASLRQKEKRRHGLVSGHRSGPEFRVYYVANRIINVCYQCQSSTCYCRMDTKPHLRRRSLFLLQTGAKLNDYVF